MVNQNFQGNIYEIVFTNGFTPSSTIRAAHLATVLSSAPNPNGALGIVENFTIFPESLGKFVVYHTVPAEPLEYEISISDDNFSTYLVKDFAYTNAYYAGGGIVGYNFYAPGVAGNIQVRLAAVRGLEVGAFAETSGTLPSLLIAPTLSVSAVSATSYIASWNSVGAASYKIQLTNSDASIIHTELPVIPLLGVDHATTSATIDIPNGLAAPYYFRVQAILGATTVYSTTSVIN